MTELIQKVRILEIALKVKDLLTHLDRLHVAEEDLVVIKTDMVTSYAKIKEDMNKLLADLSNGSKVQ